MRKILLVLIAIWLFMPTVCAQKVGLVLSGGGAKGLTHIGIIRALEEGIMGCLGNTYRLVR